MQRAELIATLSDRIDRLACHHPARVAIDGVDGVGKTSLADELATALRTRGRQVIRAAIDGFHNPRRLRYRRGRSSPEGYFLDSFDHEALIAVLLAPLGPGGARRYRRAVFDYRTDSEATTPEEIASPDAILLFDGVFLHRPELLPYWDLGIFLEAPFAVTVARMAARDGGSPDVQAAENRRYVEGQDLYLRACEPQRAAAIVVDNENLAAPHILRWQLLRDDEAGLP